MLLRIIIALVYKTNNNKKILYLHLESTSGFYLYFTGWATKKGHKQLKLLQTLIHIEALAYVFIFKALSITLTKSCCCSWCLMQSILLCFMLLMSFESPGGFTQFQVLFFSSLRVCNSSRLFFCSFIILYLKVLVKNILVFVFFLLSSTLFCSCFLSSFFALLGHFRFYFLLLPGFICVVFF